MRPNTRMLYAECPGSLVYEMCDLPALAAMAHERGAIVVADNTWGSGYQYRPLLLGADVSVMAATKYLSGHSDVMMGTVATTEAAWGALAERCDAFGMTVSPDDAWLVLRGMRTLAARLQMHEQHALTVAKWLLEQPAVRTVFCPALPSHPGHELWLRDCQGTNGLVSFELPEGTPQANVDRFIDSLRLFGLGASWGATRAWSQARTSPRRVASQTGAATGRWCACTSASRIRPISSRISHRASNRRLWRNSARPRLPSVRPVATSTRIRRAHTHTRRKP